MKDRYYDFPIGFLGVNTRLEVLTPDPEDPYGITFFEWTDPLALSHFGRSFIYEMARRPTHLDYPKTIDVPNWEMYVSKQEHARQALRQYLPLLLKETGPLRICSTEYCLHESNFNEGAPPKSWERIELSSAYDASSGLFAWEKADDCNIELLHE